MIVIKNKIVMAKKKYRLYVEYNIGDKHNLLGEFSTKDEALDFAVNRAINDGSIKTSDSKIFRTTLDKCGYSHKGYCTESYTLYDPDE